MKVPAFAPTQTFNTPSIHATSLYMAASSSDDAVPSRRAFMRRSAGIAFSAATAGGFFNFDGHSAGCQCSSCSGTSDHGDGCNCASCANGKDHSLGCQCTNCMHFGPLSAAAYERDVGDANRSADSYAMNLQARETNARLEKSGFKLDTKEEESARINDAFASFSYDSVSSTQGQKQGQKSGGKGYGARKNDAASSSTK